MSTILELLPNPAALDDELTPVLNKFTSLVTKGQGFSSGDLQTVLTAGGNLPIPNSFTLVSETLNNLGEIAAKLPSKPEEITATLEQGLKQLLQSGGALGDLLTPITQFLEVITPLLEKFEFLNNSVTRINQIVSGLSGQVENLNLANLPEQLEYFSRIFTVFPEVNDVSPFKELKAQVDSLKVWLSANSATLTQQFQAQIQALANALPTRVNQVMQTALEAVSQIEAPLTALEYSHWLTPYNQALAVVEAINLNDLSQIDTYLTVLETQVSTVNEIALDLTQKTQSALDNLEGFDVSLFSQNLRYALQTILSTISPATPSVLAGLFRQMQKLVGGLEIGAVQSAIAQIDQQIDQLIGKVDFSAFPEKIEAIATQITSTVDSVDQGLVSVATFLSNLVNELRDLISSVDLPKLLNQVQVEFDQLSSQVNGLLSQVNAIPQQLESLVTELGTDVENLDLDALKEAIAQLLGEITSVLNDPQIQQIRSSAQQGIEAIANNLSNVSLKPVFERVLSEMADVKTKLATVDVSQLNELLKTALKLALEAIRQINFAQDVADKLKQEFQEILNNSTGLIEPLQEKYQEIVAQIEQFAPGTWIAGKLTPPFEKLVAELEKVEPSKLLAPLKALYTSLLKQLETLSPTALLAPLSTLHGRLMASLRSLSPHDLIAPLNNLLKQVTSLLDQLGVEAFISQITNTVGKINTLIGNLSLGQELQNSDFWTIFKQLQIQGTNLLQDAEAQLNQYLDKLIDLVPAVDMGVLQPVLNQLRQAIATIENHITHPTVLSRLQQIPATLNAQPFQNGVTDLTKRWLAQKKRFNEITPPPEVVQAYEELKAKLQLLSPIQLLGRSATSVERFTASLNGIQTELTLSQQALSNLLASNQDKLTALLPKEATAAGFKQLLRDGLEEQIGRPAKELLRSLKQQLARFDQVFAGIQAIALKFEAPTHALTVIPASINRISQALLEAKAKITNLNLNFLEDELQGVIDEIINQLGSLNPNSLLASLEVVYKTMLNAVKQLYPEAAISQLDTSYKETVLQKLKDLHPSKTIAPPLDKEYQKILELQQQLNVDKIFEPLTGKLDTLERELDDGLARTGTAFNQLLQALPL